MLKALPDHRREGWRGAQAVEEWRLSRRLLGRFSACPAAAHRLLPPAACLFCRDLEFPDQVGALVDRYLPQLKGRLEAEDGQQAEQQE